MGASLQASSSQQSVHLIGIGNLILVTIFPSSSALDTGLHTFLETLLALVGAELHQGFHFLVGNPGSLGPV